VRLGASDRRLPSVGAGGRIAATGGMMIRLLAVAAMVSLGGWALPAAAQDRDPCGAEMVCASDPDTVFAAMERAHMEPSRTTDSAGDPMIESDAGPFHFDVYFYGCEQNRNCDSLRFEAVFAKGPENTLELANDWNASKRFLQASVKPDGRFAVAYDIGTIGGVNRRNFADHLDWWQSMLGELGSYFVERLGSEDATEAATAE